MPTDEDKHLEDLPEHGAEMIEKIIETLMPLCPGCQIMALGFICGIIIRNINDAGQKEFFRQIMKHAWEVSQSSPEEDEKVRETMH